MRTSPPELTAEYRRRGAWADTRITDLFDTAVRVNPSGLAVADAPNRALLCGDAARRLSFTELQQLVSQYLLRFVELGLERGHILITQLPNIAEYTAVYLAALKLGVILSPVPIQFGRGDLEKVMRLTDARALLTVAKFKGAEPALDAMAAAQGLGVQVLVLGDLAAAGAFALAPRPVSTDEQKSLEAKVQALGITADDIATICWTSGTEGVPKGVPRSHNHWLAISPAHFRGASIRRGDVLLNPFPLVNMAALGGCFLSWLHAAGTLLLHHPFDLRIFLEQIAHDRPDYTVAAPALLNMLLADQTLLSATDLSSLRCIGSGSAPLDPAMIRAFRDRFGIEIVNMFGSNEGMALISGAATVPDPDKRATLFPGVGHSVAQPPQQLGAGLETRIVDLDTGTEILTAAHAGEMQIRGPSVFDGYFRAPELTAAAFTRDGYFRTGDLFEIAAEGGPPRFYRFVGRLKQLIVRGGMKIAPEEIEAVLAQHPDIAECSAIPYSDPVMGERVCAVVVPRQRNKSITIEGIRTHCRTAGLSIFKWPERVHCVECLPRNAIGKVVRSALAEMLERSK